MAYLMDLSTEGGEEPVEMKVTDLQSTATAHNNVSATNSVEAPKKSEKRPNVSHDEWPTLTLSNQEEQLYDRQIRLWGIEVQQRLMGARVLFIGMNGIQEEGIKNLILAGMGVTLASSRQVTEEDVGCSFFLRHADIGSNHAEALVHRMRDMVLNKERIKFTQSPVVKASALDGSEYYDIDDAVLANYDVISLTDETFPITKLVNLNKKCRDKGIAFIVSAASGTQGLIFQDLNTHTVLEKISKQPGTVTIEYRSLSTVLSEPQFPRRCDAIVRKNVAYLLMRKAHPETIGDPNCAETFGEDLKGICTKCGTSVEEVKSLFKSQGKPFAVTSGVLGGYLALAIRNFVTKQYETFPNFCVFDMNKSTVTTAMI
ncbi:ubiquitin-activating enzyme like protein [Babesia gibsoni]|uniref:Ubiquitin-activating enzyme like protein n=1 Tax=Babesia gibsoni TaxID=33632 RepID=A0AAD8PFE4_BABGI|nr:ubiquitin-activating enzyme like protein [Babesia gibsoni]